MATFKYYNIQIIPMNKEDAMIGTHGYKSVFAALATKVKASLTNKDLRTISHSLRNDFYIAPESITVRDDIAYGVLMKYDNVEKVFGTLDGVDKYISKGGDSSKKYRFRFVFDFSKHIMAIENSKGLPSANVLSSVLQEIISQHSTILFPKYNLHVIEMTDASELKNVIEKAASYKRVSVELTFSNSQAWSDALEDAILKEIEEEMKDKRIDSLVHIEKAGDKSVMTEPTKSAMAYLGLACKFGNASIRYKDALGKTETYKMTDSPIVITVKEKFKNKLKSAIDFALDVKDSITTANKKALDAKAIAGKLKEGINNENKSNNK